MKIHYIMHAAFESLGVIEDWALENNHDLSSTSPYAGEKLPEKQDFDFLIILGGPQSSCEMDKYPYLQDEIEFAKTAIKENKKMLGICLGAQIIAKALGAEPLKSPNREIGQYPIELSDLAKNDLIFGKFPNSFDVMHWHSDMPGISEGMVILAKSEGCPNQAYRYGDRIYGMQFHLELTKKSVESLIQNCPEDLLQGKFIRSQSELLASDFNIINNKMHLFLEGFSKII